MVKSCPINKWSGIPTQIILVCNSNGGPNTGLPFEYPSSENGTSKVHYSDVLNSDPHCTIKMNVQKHITHKVLKCENKNIVRQMNE